MMKVFGAVVLFMTLSAVCGLRCYQCTSGKSCTEQLTCPPVFERCTSFVMNGVVTKGCMLSNLCLGPVKCCATDLCNSDHPADDIAKPEVWGVTDTKPKPSKPKSHGSIPKPTGSSNIPTGSSVLLLLVSSSIITLFL
ncbi:secreted Ly-6/uPAR domain-containing protein 2-like [Plectropomus leopardus]|uniref:secreted Ly-6/uPAR domain-containing protein 2-like n=1 Tax=Plectropomus leopardus TaxID=160734 RepID=UPI001C4BC4E4|nr:secreted Ly-6/uPAR domain-containing protein 2-like [Plectropomus leopardus]